MRRTAVWTACFFVWASACCRAAAGDQEDNLKKAREYYQQGKKALVVGDYPRANEFFSRAEVVLHRQAQPLAAAEQAPVSNDPEFYYHLGILYDRYLNRPDDAVNYYRRYGELAPGGIHAQEVAGRIASLRRRSSDNEQR